MPPWRPRQRIRVIAIGLHWREGRLLAAEVCDDAGRLKGVRPLGGEVRFREAWADALRREFQEELGIDVALSGDVRTMENFFVHEGMEGHEIVFVSDVLFLDATFSDVESVTYHEDNGVSGEARWYDLADLDRPGGPRLFPDGLKALLLRDTGVGGGDEGAVRDG
ncbi:MAG: NUDIX domain-containing protein [Pseudomonadota bacterium]